MNYKPKFQNVSNRIKEERLLRSKRIKFSITLEYIAKSVSFYYNCPLSNIFKDTRKRDIVSVRQICMFFAYYLIRLKLSDIGLYYGNKDHASVIYSKKTIQNFIDIDNNFYNDILAINRIFFNNKVNIVRNKL